MTEKNPIHPILDIMDSYPEYARLASAIEDGRGPFSVFGLGEAHRSHIAAAFFKKTGRPMLIVSASESASVRIQEEISSFLDGDECLHFPARELLTAQRSFAQSSGLIARRMRILSRLCAGEPLVAVASAEALMQRMISPEALIAKTVSLTAGDRIDPVKLVESLVLCGYERSEVCESAGQAARRGGYVDVFPITAENPVRIEFFDDEIDTLREYDALSQRSMRNIGTLSIPPMTESSDNGSTLRDYFAQEAIILIDEPPRVEESAKAAYENFLYAVSMRIEKGEASVDADEVNLLMPPLDALGSLHSRRTVMLFALTRTWSLIGTKAVFRFETRFATQYRTGYEMLAGDLTAWRKNGYTVMIYAGTHAAHLQEGLLDADAVLPVKEELDRRIVPGESLIIAQSLTRGFEYPEPKLVVLTENELYGSMPKPVASQRRRRPQLAFTELSVGDLVVHELHGIGRFVGVETLVVGGAERDYLHLIYAGHDKLYIPTDQLDRVQKYIGGDEEKLKLSKLGTGEWQKTVNRTRESVKRLAFDLIKLYGERNKQKGHRFSKDTQWQRRLESSFQYEETPDQLTSLTEIKRDMESERVMDRLLCGDVGYGKTEVALRAAFKAVMDGKQAALLVPTTILAQQHYNTISARFSGFPVEVAILSRFNTAKEEKAILKRVKEGAVDVIVGTHRLLSKDVAFKDLGLLIIDEEQHFGVGHKEGIKNMKKSVDVLTLSATPIPRTLHMSMTGIRDMSVIETPPDQRYPVQTYVMEYGDTIVREAILKELGRGGQVYFVYNNVRGMERFTQRIRELVPEARIAHAHGQMNERVLESTMLDFMAGGFDVLVCSTIIESGLDIQNVNTMIVYDADCFGLSQLYQLRGRIGRGTRLGYAYLMFRRDKVLTEIAEKRLLAIREFTQFGAGFKIAMRDLEIRGAGNLLGAEQSGHMASVGYDLYCKIVDEAVKEASGEEVVRVIDTVVETPLCANIPHEYIPRETDRLFMYKRIAMISGRDDLYDVQDELLDRYGDIPAPVGNLLTIALIKAYASRAYVTRVLVKEGEARLTFDAGAKLNAAKLLELVMKTEGAQLIYGETPALVIRRSETEGGPIHAWLPQFVYTLCNCID